MKKILLFLLISAGVTITLFFYSSDYFKDKDTHIKKTEKDLFTNKKDISKSETFEDKTQKVSFALEIKGDDEFKIKVKNAIRLLWLNDKGDSFALIRRYVFEIRQSQRTTFIFEEEKPVIEISNDMAKNTSLTFLASVIAHNAWHGWYLTEKKKKKKKDEVPHPKEDKIEKTFITPFGYEFKKYEDLFSIEERAFQYQLSILQKLNAPQNELNLIIKRKKNDFSPAHDGNFIIEF